VVGRTQGARVPGYLKTFGCGQVPAPVGPAQVVLAHGMNAGRDAPDMVSSSKRSMCEGPLVGPHDTRDLQL